MVDKITRRNQTEICDDLGVYGIMWLCRVKVEKHQAQSVTIWVARGS